MYIENVERADNKELADFTSIHHRTAGHALKEMFNFAPVQSFFNSMTAKALFPHKAIYQPGTLRKVSCYLQTTMYVVK